MMMMMTMVVVASTVQGQGVAAAAAVVFDIERAAATSVWQRERLDDGNFLFWLPLEK